MLRTLSNRRTALALMALLFVIGGSNLYAVSVGDPEIKTDDVYFPGELAMSTLERIKTHAYSIPRGTVGVATQHDQLIKLFLWRCEHYTHLDSPQVDWNPTIPVNPAGGNTLIIDYDTMHGLFSYGYGVCGTNHAQFRAIAEHAGFGHRRRGLPGDTGQEIFENGGWRYVNTDQYTLHFLTNSLSSDFASLDEVVETAGHYIEWNPDLGGGYFMPQANTHGNYNTFAGVTGNIPFRSLQWRSYYNGVWTTTLPSPSDWASIKPQIMYAEGFEGTPIVFRLRRGETFTRWEKPDGVVNDLGVAGRCWYGYNGGSGAGSPHANWSFAQNAPARDQIASGTEVTTLGGGMDNGNACYHWVPSLANSEYLDGLADQTGTYAVGGSPMLKATGAGKLTFEFSSPYVICGHPTQNNGSGKPDPALVCTEGAVLTTTFVGLIGVDVSTDQGASWVSKGNLTSSVDFTDLVKGKNSYLIRLSVPVNAGLNSLDLRTICQTSQAVYPNLKNGLTTVNYAAGNTGMLDLSPNLRSAATANSLTGYVQKYADSGNLTDDFYTIGPVNGKTWAYDPTDSNASSITYKISIPNELKNAGATFNQIFAAQDRSVASPPNPGSYGKIEIAPTGTGPWTQIANYAVPTDNTLSHFWSFGRSTDGTNLGGTDYYVRFTGVNAGHGCYIRYLRINALYNVGPSGAPLTVTYYWNNGTPQSSTPHVIAAGAASDMWTIDSTGLTAQEKVVFSVASGGVAPPIISTQPANITVTAPATATFTVVASGTGLTYQWKRGGSPILGATSASYTTSATSVAGDNGATFTVDVTNAGGTVGSNIATLTVVAAGSPVITVQPANQTVTQPATATFSVTATGATSYQWKRNGSPIVGATSSTYTTGATTVAADNAAQFTVDVINGSGTVTSNIATLTVNPVVGPPTTVTFQDGIASYTGTLDTYVDQYQASSSFGTQAYIEVDYNVPPTATENTIGLLKFDLSSIPAGATITSASLDLWVTRVNNLSTSDQLVLDKVTSTWNESTPYTSLPTSTPSGVTPPTVTITPNGAISPSQQYTITGLGTLVQGWVTTPGSNFGMMLSYASGENVRYASREGAIAAEHPMLTVTYSSGGAAPVITVQPVNQVVTAPAAATFSVTATGATSYQWQLGGSNITGANSSSYTITPTNTGLSGGVYRVLVTNASGTTTSNNATLTVNPGVTPPNITVQPANQTVTQPAAATFSVTATGATSYQWQKNTVDIALATSSSYTVTPTSTAMTGDVYRVKVTNAGGTVTSNNATLTVNPPVPVITTQPGSQTVTAPSTATFTVVATGATSYQWKRGGAPIVGATSASYTTAATSVAGDNGAIFSVDVTNGTGTVTSNNATLIVNSAGNPITPSASTLTFTATTGSTVPVTQTLTLTNGPGTTITVTPSSNQTWMTTGGAVTIAASSNGTLSVTVNPTGLSGANTANLTLTNSTGGTQVLTVNLNMTVPTGNMIVPSVSSVSLGAPIGSLTPVTTTITLHNSDTVPITVTPSSANGWLSTSGPVTIPPGSTVTLTITGSPSGLTGLNSGTLTLTNSTGGTQTIPVSFTVGVTTGQRKRSCSISQGTNPDVYAWLLGLVVLAGMATTIRRRMA